MTEESHGLREIKEYQKEKIEVIYRKATPADKSMPPGKYPELAPGVTTEDGIICERDVPVTMRDGTTIYTDIYRPEGGKNLPAIIGWSPYGKRAGYIDQHVLGVPEGVLSSAAKFEAPDPGYWCWYGYAVINPDSRGAGNSEGDISFWGTQDGKDGYDFIEWLAARDWCNGRIGLAGNSWLAIAQWYIAAEKPPHLAAIAPWEGQSDWYRDGLFPGGVPEPGFVGFALSALCGPNCIEDAPAMMKKYPLMNAFWEDRRAVVENIEIPCYIASSYNPLHVHGTLDAYQRIPSKMKWLRIHNTQEWPDSFSPEGLEDLRRFFDRYLKGIRNGWEFTSKVRVSVLDPGAEDIINRPETEWPLPQTQYHKLYLDGSTMKLSPEPIAKESSVRYKADDGKSQAVFTMKFDKDTELTGYMKMHLWVEAEGSDDMDLFVYVSKLDEQGNELLAKVITFPNPGIRGTLRVSHREVDETKPNKAFDPFLTHGKEQFLKPGEIVPVDFGIWPGGMLFHTGQQIRVVVKGWASLWMEDVLMPFGPIFKWDTRNKGAHIIHTGGKYDSYIQVPNIPIKS